MTVSHEVRCQETREAQSVKQGIQGEQLIFWRQRMSGSGYTTCKVSIGHPNRDVTNSWNGGLGYNKSVLEMMTTELSTKRFWGRLGVSVG